MEQLLSSQSWVLWSVLIVIAFFAGRASGGGMSSEERMQRKMEERQQAERLFAGLSPEVQQNIDAQIQSGKVIEAIKIVRVNSGAGLKDAKQAVDARRASMGAV
jgi:ribosomal protein L7/L12